MRVNIYIKKDNFTCNFNLIHSEEFEVRSKYTEQCLPFYTCSGLDFTAFIPVSFFFLLQGVQRDTIISRSSSQMKLWTYKMADLHFLTLSLVPPFWDNYMPTHTALGFHGWDNVRRGRVKHNRHAAVSSPAVGCN